MPMHPLPNRNRRRASHLQMMQRNAKPSRRKRRQFLLRPRHEIQTSPPIITSMAIWRKKTRVVIVTFWISWIYYNLWGGLVRFMSCCVKSKGLLLHNNSQAVFAEKDRQSQGIILADDKAISQKEQSKAEDSQKMHRRCTEDAQKMHRRFSPPDNQ